MSVWQDDSNNTHIANLGQKFGKVKFGLFGPKIENKFGAYMANMGIIGIVLSHRHLKLPKFSFWGQYLTSKVKNSKIFGLFWPFPANPPQKYFFHYGSWSPLWWAILPWGFRLWRIFLLWGNLKGDVFTVYNIYFMKQILLLLHISLVQCYVPRMLGSR